MNELILDTTEDRRSRIKLRTGKQTVWLAQFDMAELFDATKQNIPLHPKNIFKDGELNPAASGIGPGQCSTRCVENRRVTPLSANTVESPVTHGRYRGAS